MKFEELTDRLSTKQKKRLKEAKTEEELSSVRLSDDLLEGVSGGSSIWDEDCKKFGCFQPSDDVNTPEDEDDKYILGRN